ncbi:MAG: dihydroflavonol-4-reductase, partial [Kiritimatiellia bacterium]
MKVLVTGAAGFIAGHCVRELLEHGHTVRGTVRDASAQDKIGYLKELGDVELVEADLLNDAGWRAAVDGCDAVLHTASPLIMSLDESKVITPAVQGTLRVLRAAAAAGVRRVVLTSSAAAIINCDAEVYTEAHWSDPERCTTYPKSKTLAERAAWDFVDAQPESERLELVTCNPSLVLGPLLNDRMSLSIEPVRRLMSQSIPAIPHVGFSIVDVRDVAIAHRLAMESVIAPGNRYLLTCEHHWLMDVSIVLKKAFADQGFRPPTMHLPYAMLWLAARFDTSLKSILADVGVRRSLDASKAKSELGWNCRPANESIIDTAQSL